MNGLILALAEPGKKGAYYFIDGKIYEEHFLRTGIDVFRGYGPRVYHGAREIIRRLDLQEIPVEEALEKVKGERLQMISLSVKG